MISLTEDNSMLGYGILDRCPGVFHFVTTRKGGCSRGTYATFNCSAYSGDEPRRVEHNRRRLIESFPGGQGELVIPYQTHGTEVRVIGLDYQSAPEEVRQKMLHGADALVTNLPGYCLCIATADCIPILLYDQRHRSVAAVHAGWRGTAGKIVTETLRTMHCTFGTEGKDLIACIGPGISPESFEVGEEVYESFRQAGFGMPQIARKHPVTGKWHIDLWSANRHLLTGYGVLPHRIEEAGSCTFLEHETFFSARRLGIRSGRIFSGIMLV